MEEYVREGNFIYYQRSIKVGDEPDPENEGQMIDRVAVEKYQYCPYYKAVLSVDKPHIAADSEDTANITATIQTWEDQPAQDYEGKITIVVDGTETISPLSDGQATFEFATDVAGVHTIMVTIADGGFFDSASLTIVAEAIEEE